MNKPTLDQWMKFFYMAALIMFVLLVLVCMNGCAGSSTSTAEEITIQEAVFEEGNTQQVYNITVSPLYESPEAHITITITYENDHQRYKIMNLYSRYINEFASSVDYVWWSRECFKNDCFGVE